MAGAPDATDVEVNVDDGFDIDVPDETAVDGERTGRSR